jgi:hypothetical protein
MAGKAEQACYGARMTKRFARPLLLALLASSLGACATGNQDRYPSLAPRDVERISGTAQPVEAQPAPAPVAPSIDLAERLVQLREQAERAHAQFMGTVPHTRQLVATASGAAVASENWSVAQAALGGLEAARNPALIALADLDGLYVKSEMDVGAVEAIETTRDAVKALVALEEQELDGLAGGGSTQ